MLLKVILPVASGLGDGENILIPAFYLLSRYFFDTRITFNCENPLRALCRRKQVILCVSSENVENCDERCKAR